MHFLELHDSCRTTEVDIYALFHGKISTVVVGVITFISVAPYKIVHKDF